MTVRDINAFLPNIGKKLPSTFEGNAKIDQKITGVCYRKDDVFYEIEERWSNINTGYIGEWETVFTEPVDDVHKLLN